MFDFSDSNSEASLIGPNNIISQASSSFSEDKIHASWVTDYDEKGKSSIDIVVEWLGTGNNYYSFSERTETDNSKHKSKHSFAVDVSNALKQAGHADRTPKGVLGQISGIEVKFQNIAKDLEDGKFGVPLDVLAEHPLEVRQNVLKKFKYFYYLRRAFTQKEREPAPALEPAPEPAPAPAPEPASELEPALASSFRYHNNFPNISVEKTPCNSIESQESANKNTKRKLSVSDILLENELILEREKLALEREKARRSSFLEGLDRLACSQAQVDSQYRQYVIKFLDSLCNE